MGATSAAYCCARLSWSVWTPPSAFRELLTVARRCALRSPEHDPGMVSPFSTEESRTVSTLQQLELRDGIKGSHWPGNTDTRSKTLVNKKADGRVSV